MSLVSLLKGKGKSGFGYGSTAFDVTEGLDLSGKRFLITGCTSGLGAEAMRVLIQRGASVVGTARTIEKARSACGDMGQGAFFEACELSEPQSVQSCVNKLRALGLPLSGIIANAGIMAPPQLVTKYGLELQFLTNHMGHFQLVTQLLDLLADDGRVVILSSSAHNMAPKNGIDFDNLDGSRGYSPWKAYGQSKLANLLFAKELARRLNKGTQTANAVHPGVINTGLQRSMSPFLAGTLSVMGPLVLKTVEQGAATEVFVATHESIRSTSGEYFADCNVARSSAISHDEQLAKKLWDQSEQWVSAFGR